MPSSHCKRPTCPSSATTPTVLAVTGRQVFRAEPARHCFRVASSPYETYILVGTVSRMIAVAYFYSTTLTSDRKVLFLDLVFCRISLTMASQTSFCSKCQKHHPVSAFGKNKAGKTLKTCLNYNGKRARELDGWPDFLDTLRSWNTPVSYS